jgi:flagellar protein FlgJ
MSFPAVHNVNDLAELGKIKLSAKHNDPQALKAAAKQFEALFMQQLLKSARAAKVGDEAFGGEQTGFYQDMFDQQMAQHLAAGKGLGIADLLVRQLQAKSSLTPLPSGEAAPKGAGEGSLHGYERVVSKAALTPTPLPQGEGTKKNALTGDEVKNAKQAFIEQILPHAEKAAKELGVPAQALIAQAALETGWGKHVVKKADGSSSFNLFGIKADKSWDGDALVRSTGEYTRGRMHTEQAGFRSYASVGEAFNDYVRFLKGNPRYAQALKMSDTSQFAQSLQKAGYATDPAYAQKIAAIADNSGMQVAIAQTKSSWA